MTISAKLKEFLVKEDVNYEALKHPVAYTAQETASSSHIPGKQTIKSVIVKVGGGYAMCVLPAIHMLDLPKLRAVMGTDDVDLASEQELAQLFPDYEIGAEPPFGHLYGIPVYSDKVLEEDETVVFNAGTHTDCVRLQYDDFVRLAKPTVAVFGKRE